MKVKVLLISSLLLAGCAEPDRRGDALTLIYLDHKVFAKGAVLCKVKPFSERTMVGCRNVSLDGQSMVHLWEYREDAYYAINGTARGLAERRFANEYRIKVPPLPLPPDIDIPRIIEAFNAD